MVVEDKLIAARIQQLRMDGSGAGWQNQLRAGTTEPMSCDWGNSTSAGDAAEGSQGQAASRSPWIKSEKHNRALKGRSKRHQALRSSYPIAESPHLRGFSFARFFTPFQGELCY